MTSSLKAVEEFYKAFGVVISNEPNIEDESLNLLRIHLLKEELDELETALDERNLVEVLDALIDIQYVLDGAVLSLGFSTMKDEAFNEVHRSNMSKLDVDGKPIYREDRKILKGPNFSPPDLLRILEKFYLIRNTT